MAMCMDGPAGVVVPSQSKLKEPKLSTKHIDTLVALIENGPLADALVPDKIARDELIRMGYAARIVVRGERNYQAATYKGSVRYLKLFGGETIFEAMINRKNKEMAEIFEAANRSKSK